MMHARNFLNGLPDAHHLHFYYMTTYIKHLQSRLQAPVEIKHKDTSINS